MSQSPEPVDAATGENHDLISALKPDQQKLKQLTDDLQRMQTAPSVMDRVKAFGQGGMDNAQEKLRNEIAEVQKTMFDKISQQTLGNSAAGVALPEKLQQLKEQTDKLQRQLTLDNQLKKDGLPGLFSDDQRSGVEQVVSNQVKKLNDEMAAEKQAVEKPQHKTTVAESLGRDRKHSASHDLGEKIRTSAPSIRH